MKCQTCGQPLEELPDLVDGQRAYVAHDHTEIASRLGKDFDLLAAVKAHPTMGRIEKSIPLPQLGIKATVIYEPTMWMAEPLALGNGDETPAVENPQIELAPMAPTRPRPKLKDGDGKRLLILGLAVGVGALAFYYLDTHYLHILFHLFGMT